MPVSNQVFLRVVRGLAVLTIVLSGCSSLTGPPAVQSSITGPGNRPARGSQDLYIGNIGGGVLLYSTGKNPRELGEITDELPRVTSVWVDQTGVLYAFSDNRESPYETIEEFQPGNTIPFFSLVPRYYGLLVAADAAQNVYVQGANGQGQQVIDVYPPGSQSVAAEYVVPTIGKVSGPQGMAFDSTGALLVGVAALAHNRQGQIGAVFRLGAGSSTFANLNLKKAYGGLIAIDGAGNLYVGGGRLISVYAPGATSPYRIVHTKETVVTLTVAADGTLYVDTYAGGITVYSPGKTRSKHRFVPPAQVSGLALGPG